MSDAVGEIHVPRNTFVRSAALRFRVLDVQKSSNNIEDIVKKNHGYIVSANYNADVIQKTTTAYNADSLLETKRYVINNTMSVKIPNEYLDATLRDCNHEITFLDNKTVKADDVYLQLLSNKLKVKRHEVFQNRLARQSDKLYKNLNKVSQAEENILTKQEASDEATIDNLDLQQQIEYSTIDLELYQNEKTAYTIVANERNIMPYEPPFYLKLWGNLKESVEVFGLIVLAIVKWWMLLLSLFLMYLGIKKYKARSMVTP